MTGSLRRATRVIATTISLVLTLAFATSVETPAHASSPSTAQAPAVPRPGGSFKTAPAVHAQQAARRAAAGPATDGPGGGFYTHTPAPNSDPAGDLTAGAGPVMHNAVMYLDFWLPSGHFDTDAAGDTAYENKMSQFINDMSGTEFFGLMSQYSDSNGAIQNNISVGGTTVSTNALPHAGTTADPLTFQNIVDEAHRANVAHGWTEDDNHMTIVFTGSGIQSCKGSACTPGGYCAYHNYATATGASNPTVFAFMPQGDSLGDCSMGGPFPNKQSQDIEISAMSHEIFEAVTDPHLNGTWTDTNGGSGEIGDKCAYNPAPRNDAGADMYLNGRPYAVQQEWSNAVHTCAMDLRNNNVVPPSVSFAKSVDNAAPNVGDSVNYTLALNNSSDTGAATNLTVSDTVPAGYQVTNVSAPNADSATTTSNSATVKYDTLAVHQPRTITITATVPNQPEQPATNCAQLALQDLLTNDRPGQQSNPCAQTTPLDQQITVSNRTLHATEGAAFSGTVASFTDPDPNGTAGEYVASVDWGDGHATSAAVTGVTGGPFTVSGTHIYADEGPYTATVNVHDTDNSYVKGTVFDSVTVADAALTAGAPTTLAAVEGAAFSGVVGTFADADASAPTSDYSGFVDWGDGSSSNATFAGSGPVRVSGTHTYEEEGSYPITVQVADDGGSAVTLTGTVDTADAALSPGPSLALSAVEGATFSASVGTFTDADPHGAATDYTATIDWGDGHTTPAGISGTGPFTLLGTHVYEEEGNYQVKAFVADEGGATTSVSDTMHVADAPLTGIGITRTTVNPVTGPVAMFTDADPFGTASDYSATINWGDGSPVTGATISTSGSTFVVNGTHTYAGSGPFVFTVQVSICDVGGACTHATSTLKITYETGLAFGASGSLTALLGTATLKPTPTTGAVVTSLPKSVNAGCKLSVRLGLIALGALCARVDTTTTPSASTAIASVGGATVKLGPVTIPVIAIGAVQVTSRSVCGSATGSTAITALKIGGVTYQIPTKPNSVISVGPIKLIVNEQLRTVGPGGDGQLTVNGVHLIVTKTAGVALNLILASATSDIHNCP
jgi:uncharacterized repeat protein (TIGR01451 family)